MFLHLSALGERPRGSGRTRWYGAHVQGRTRKMLQGSVAWCIWRCTGMWISGGCPVDRPPVYLPARVCSTSSAAALILDMKAGLDLAWATSAFAMVGMAEDLTHSIIVPPALKKFLARVA